MKRIIDVNLNRFNEGMRVLEELLRFYFEDASLTRQAKIFRHSFSSFVKKSFSATELYISRDIAEDVGKDISTDDEEVRNGLEEIFYSNAGRVKESMRVVEEYLKLFDSDLSSEIEKLRYAFYDLEREVSLLFQKRVARFYRSKLYPIFSPVSFDDNFKDICGVLRDISPAVLQLRMKDISTREYMAAARFIRESLPGTVLFINDRVDVALASGANGVHIGDFDMDYKTVRSMARDSLLIGVSAVDLAGVQRYRDLDPDYVGIGPIYETSSKTNAAEPLGIESAVSIASQFPDICKVAIGGIDSEKTSSLLENGYQMVAVISDIFTGDIKANFERYIELLGPEGVIS